MDNFNQPAFPIVDATDKSSIAAGFTKLEYAALLIAQGFMAGGIFADNKNAVIAEESVSLAEAVLEEAAKRTK